VTARKQENVKVIHPVSLLVYEGETEEIFYPIVREKYLRRLRYDHSCIKGQGRTNLQIINAAITFCLNNPSEYLRVYSCIDTERGKQGIVPFDINYVRSQIADMEKTRIVNNLGIKKVRQIKRQILSITAIQADPDIESWFFYDIEGIYKFLRAPKSKRNIKKYTTPSQFGKKDLKRLFRQFDNQYREGQRARNFIESLNMDKIVAGCTELREGIELIRTRSQDMTNHIFK